MQIYNTNLFPRKLPEPKQTLEWYLREISRVSCKYAIQGSSSGCSVSIWWTDKELPDFVVLGNDEMLTLKATYDKILAGGDFDVRE